MTNQRHQLQSRRVEFDLSQSPVHWLPDDPFASQLINGIHMILPAGELFFCRVFNKALPHITDAQLVAEVKGFIRQEAIHARVHARGQSFLEQQGYDTRPYLRRLNWIFEDLLGDAPLGLRVVNRAPLRHQWLVLRVGIVAAIEHFTGLLGDWCMNSQGWDDGDPVVADLFRWHLAEEVEHRSVAFDLYEHLCRSRSGFYLSRQALMALVFPLFIYVVHEAAQSLIRQDPDPVARRRAKKSLLRALWTMEVTGRSTNRVPRFSFIVRRTVNWISPNFHPITEGNTQQALDYIARSPAAQAAENAVRDVVYV